MKQPLREARYFLFGQHFAEGLRITFAILTPSLISAYLGYFELGLSISLGALCVSITDAPGPTIHRRNGMLAACICIFISAIITGFAQANTILLGLEIVAVAFLFSMFNVYGLRAAAVGSAGLLVVILNMDKSLSPAAVVPHSLLILAGGIWYLCISLLISALRPYRLAQRVFGDALREVAQYLAIKGDFYDTKTDLASSYRRLIDQQIIVHEKQEATREILFKTRQIIQESSAMGKRLMFSFIESVDLFEDITASYYDYAALRNRFGETGVLEPIAALIKQQAQVLERMGFAIQSNTPYQPQTDLDSALYQLKDRIDAQAAISGQTSHLLLKKILVNLRRISKRLKEIQRYFEAEAPPVTNRSGAAFSRFVGHQAFNTVLLRENLSFDSALFRYALRTAIVCLAGYILSKTLSLGQHSYWILLTIAFIMKPGFSLTKERNVQRIIGTLAGGMIGVLILLFISNTYVLFAFLVVFMIITYSFLRLNYLVMVLSVTPFVIILFHFLGLGYIGIVQERLVDTLLGCGIAFIASYLFLPKWESEQVPLLLKQLLQANLKYLEKVVAHLSGHRVSSVDHKLARKEVYVQSANLSAAFQRMLSEPKDKQRNSKALHQFVVLNNILFSNIATLAASTLPKEPRIYPAPVLKAARRSLTRLCESLQVLDPGSQLLTIPLTAPAPEISSMDDALLEEQLQFIENLSADIGKAVREVNA
jgi:uncharacterized membrane protein (TIGR01666 family)